MNEKFRKWNRLRKTQLKIKRIVRERISNNELAYFCDRGWKFLWNISLDDFFWNSQCRRLNQFSNESFANELQILNTSTQLKIPSLFYKKWIHEITVHFVGELFVRNSIQSFANGWIDYRIYRSRTNFKSSIKKNAFSALIAKIYRQFCIRIVHERLNRSWS